MPGLVYGKIALNLGLDPEDDTMHPEHLKHIC